MSPDQASSVPFESAGGRGFLHRPLAFAERGLVLTHGAGGNCTAPLLVALPGAFSAAGLGVLRCDLPFRQRLPSCPPPPPTPAPDRPSLRNHIAPLPAFV